ncbi:uncharacterized protein BJX67DRAFT_360290 [Aspergillus lucknowensis]|uniref:Uncharacterized protein n=1 Tax=Aspergillus lucknowensis TaxID=176173 RepID=A0ABR4LJR5_9EURO
MVYNDSKGKGKSRAGDNEAWEYVQSGYERDNEEMRKAEERRMNMEKAKLHLQPGVADYIHDVLRDYNTPVDEKIDFVTEILGSQAGHLSEAERHALILEAQNDDLRRQLEALRKPYRGMGKDSGSGPSDSLGSDYQGESYEGSSSEYSRSEELTQTAESKPSSGEANLISREHLEMIKAYQKEDRALRTALGERDATIAKLMNTVDIAGETLADYRMKMAMYERQSNEWNESLQRYISVLTQENIILKNQVAEITQLIGAARRTDASRWQHMLEESRHRNSQQQPVQKLPYGTIDKDMADAFEVDTAMSERPERYNSPVATRVRRRLARVKPGVKRAGFVEQKAARPLECRKVSAEIRAANSYLQLRNGKGKEAAEPIKVRRKCETKVLPRKRTRLAKGTDMVRRVQAVADADKLPPPPKRIGPWYSPNPYDRRNDQELSELLKKFSISRDKTETTAIQTDIPVEAKIVTITNPVENFIPRSKVRTAPRYLPEPTALSPDERKRWGQRASKWTLGPALNRKNSPKLVRFAGQVEYAPDRPTAEPVQEVQLHRRPRKTGWSLNWTHLLIVILTFLLFISHLGRSEGPKQSWQSANQRPDDFAVTLRTSTPGDSRAADFIEFEIGRYSDINPSVIG